MRSADPQAAEGPRATKTLLLRRITVMKLALYALMIPCNSSKLRQTASRFTHLRKRTPSSSLLSGWSFIAWQTAWLLVLQSIVRYLWSNLAECDSESEALKGVFSWLRCLPCHSPPQGSWGNRFRNLPRALRLPWLRPSPSPPCKHFVQL